MAFENNNQIGKQFKKGNKAAVGKGRPKGKSLKTILEAIGSNKGIRLDNETIIDCDTGEVVKELSKYESLALRLYQIAQEDEPQYALKAIGMIIDRVDGKVTDKIEQKNEYVHPPEDDIIFERARRRAAKKLLKSMTPEERQELEQEK